MNARFPLVLSISTFLVAAALGAFLSPRAVAVAAESDSLRVGDVAPDFSMKYATKDSVAAEPITLAALTKRGNVVLAFYPADWSGGCTKEVCSFRDNFSSLSAMNAQVLGVSGDYVYSHHEWAKHHELPFALASDHDHAVGKRYASYSEKSGYNRRTVYAIDKSGKIAYIDLKYSPTDPASLDKLKAALAAMK